MNHDETYQTDKFGDLLMLVTGGTNYTMAEEHLLYRKALRAVVELHKPSEKNYAGEIGCMGCGYNSEYSTWEMEYPCPTIKAIKKELG